MTATMTATAAVRLAPRERFVLLAGGTFIALTVLAGPLRMYLSLAGLAPLIYVGNLMLLLAIVWQLVAEPREQGFSAMNLIALVLPCYAMVIGLQFVSPVQVAMGFYVLLPFWYGLACGPVLIRCWHVVGRIVPLVWLVVVTGVLVNAVVEFPWEGFSYTLGNLDVEGSRQWYATGGGTRLAGFARASFDAAVQIQVAGILLALRTRSPILRLFVWLLTILAILPTTSKGVLLAVAVVTPVLLFHRLIPEAPMRTLPALFGAIGIALPVATLLFVFDSPLQDPKLANATHSFYDRLNEMWPEAWALLVEQGHWLLGRGIGGIGTAQTYFEPELFNAGDNLFLYWFVVFGWAALPGFVVLLAWSLRLRPHRDGGELRLYCLLLATLVYGGLTNIVENAVSGLVCGLLVRRLSGTRPAAYEHPPAGNAAATVRLVAS